MVRGPAKGEPSGPPVGGPVLNDAGTEPVLSGDNLRNAFEAATRCLERQKDAINALNVFPVPDGDTGTNMLLTMRSVNEWCGQAPASSVGAVTEAMARGALLGARGNSGVILSQFFHGLSQGLKGKEESNSEDLANAFALASKAADGSVSVPVDGTMLTVMREMSSATAQFWGGQEVRPDPLSVWRVALDAGKDALSRTPQQLEVLREAGVVDAGGQGVVTLLEGAWHYLAGNDIEKIDLDVCAPDLGHGISPAGRPGERPAVKEAYLEATEADLYGYCTQFLIQRSADGAGLEVDRIRDHLSKMAGSTVVVGGDDLVKVHLHAMDPGQAISYAVSQGTIAQVRLDNMDEQHGEFVAQHRSRQQTPTPVDKDGERGEAMSCGVVAVVSGEGFADLFKGLGCVGVVPGGQTMNPSTQELLQAARDSGAWEIILVANNPNIIPAARQAAALADGEGAASEAKAGNPADAMRLHVIPSRTMPQGVAALLAFNPEGSLEANLDSMNRAVSTVKTVEVTKAVRAATLGDLVVEEGQHIGLLDGDLVSMGDSALTVLEKTLMKGEPCSGQLVTLYWGLEVEEGQAADAGAHLRESIPGIDVEVVYGGQPSYDYIASLE